MVQRVTTVAFEGIEVRPVDVQVQVAPGMPAFTIVDCQCLSMPTHPCDDGKLGVFAASGF
jgi:hypothetical protein